MTVVEKEGQSGRMSYKPGLMRDNDNQERPHRGSIVAHRGWREDFRRVDLIVVGEKVGRGMTISYELGSIGDDDKLRANSPA